MPGQIVRIISNLYTVKIDNDFIDCSARGKFRNDKITPLVGDFVNVDIKTSVITNVGQRKNELSRPVVANIDLALIVTSLKKPDFSANLLDKLLVNIINAKIEPIILVTKEDLIDSSEKKELKKILKYYEQIGIKVIKNSKLSKIKKLTKNKLSILTGQTGAGKSTVLNKLNPSLNLKTSPISDALGRGVHTTRHVEIFNIDNSYFVDTPGFSSLDLSHLSAEKLRTCFIEFKRFPCKFQDCKHLNEIECGVKTAIDTDKILKSRYDNYIKFMNEVKK